MSTKRRAQQQSTSATTIERRETTSDVHDLAGAYGMCAAVQIMASEIVRDLMATDRGNSI